MFSVVLFILWHTRVEGGGGGEGEGGEGEGGWLAIAVELLPLSPLVTKWEITHVTGHGAGITLSHLLSVMTKNGQHTPFQVQPRSVARGTPSLSSKNGTFEI